MRSLVFVALAGCSLHTPPSDAPYRFRCDTGNDCVDGFYCVAGYCTEGLISAGGRHTCMLRSDGTAVCWGAGKTNTGDGAHYGQSDPLADRFVDISAGGFHTCALKPNGRAKCWGRQDDGRTTPPDVRFRQISAGLAHTCGITAAGHVACWGAGKTSDMCRFVDRDDCGQAAPPEHVRGRQYVEVAAGDYHTCVRTAMNTVECWGAGSPESETVVGSPDYDQATPPEVMGFIDTVTQLSAGAYHTCAAVNRAGITETRVGCWGAGLPMLSSWPHLGQSTPVSGEYVRVAAGGFHSCGLDIDNDIACWGMGTSVGDCANHIDECGQADPPVTWGFRFITAGHAHSCGIGIDGGVTCWGAGETETACDLWNFECGQSLPPDDLY